MDKQQQNLTPEQLELLEESLFSLLLPVKVVNTLENLDNAENALGKVVKILTVKDLLEHNRQDIESIPNIGEKTMNTIYSALAKRGFYAADYQPSQDEKAELSRQERRRQLRSQFGF
jgi:DNA-directed RNA polymerase alpha subunit